MITRFKNENKDAIIIVVDKKVIICIIIYNIY